MATLLRATLIEGSLTLPPVYGNKILTVGQTLVIADTPSNVAAALGSIPQSVCTLELTSDGQPGAIIPAPDQNKTINLFVSPTGSDLNNNGLSAAAPFATIEKAYNYSALHAGNYTANLAAGTFNLTQRAYFTPRPIGAGAVPLAIVGNLNNLYGTMAEAAGSAAGTRLTVAGFNKIRTNSTATIVAGAPAGQMRILVPGYTAADVGVSFVNSSGSTHAGNNANAMPIVGCNPGVSIDVVNTFAVIPDAGPLTITDSLDGSVIQCLTGANAGEYKNIRANTTTTFDLNLAFPHAIAIGDTFILARSNSVINPLPPNSNSAEVNFYGDALLFKFCKFTPTGNSTISFNSNLVVMVGCEIAANNAASINVVESCLLQIGVVNTTASRTFANDTTGLLTLGMNGCGLHANTVRNFMVNQGCKLNGYLVSRSANTGLSLNSGSENTLINPSMERVPIIATMAEVVIQAPTSTYPGIIDGKTVTPTITCSLNSEGTMSCVVQNSNTAGLIAQTGSEINVDRLTGTGNLDTGLWADRFGRIRIDLTGSGNTTVTGVNGDTKYGHPTVANIQTYATVRTADGSGVKGFQDAYGNRIEP